MAFEPKIMQPKVNTLLKTPQPFFAANAMPIQAKLTVNEPGDAYEQEADAVADKVMRMPDPSVFNPEIPFNKVSISSLQRKCATCDEEEKVQRKEDSEEEQPVQLKPISDFTIQRACADCEKDDEKIHRKESGNTGGGMSVPPIVSDVISNGGASLDKGTQQFMENRMGQDFSNVQVHTDSKAAESAQSINALAYTSGNHVVFGSGQYQPNTEGGKRLLAHELVHVGQQAEYIQRKTASETTEQKALRLESELLANTAYKTLDSKTKQLVFDILVIIKTKPNGENKGERNYYLEKLKIAITTPSTAKPSATGGYGQSASLDKKNREIVDKAVDFEKALGFSDYLLNVEERAVALGTNKTTRIGKQSKTFLVDRTDPRFILVFIKVKLNGAPTDVAKIKLLEDAIERNSHTTGYFVDIMFVDTTGSDVFEFDVEFGKWPNAGNWASSPVTLSHELHHALGLDDRYDYIESHSDNRDMDVPTRLLWFNEQFSKATGARDPYSKMDTSSNVLLSEDICAVAFEKEPEIKKCIEARKDLDPKGIPPI